MSEHWSLHRSGYLRATVAEADLLSQRFQENSPVPAAGSRLEKGSQQVLSSKDHLPKDHLPKDHLGKDYLVTDRLAMTYPAQVSSVPVCLAEGCSMEYPNLGRMADRMDRRLAEEDADPEVVDRRCL